MRVIELGFRSGGYTPNLNSLPSCPRKRASRAARVVPAAPGPPLARGRRTPERWTVSRRALFGALQPEFAEAGIERLILRGAHRALLAGGDDRGVFGAGRHAARGEAPALDAAGTRGRRRLEEAAARQRQQREANGAPPHQGTLRRFIAPPASVLSPMPPDLTRSAAPRCPGAGGIARRQPLRCRAQL